MKTFNELVGKNIEVEISGGKFHSGTMVDSGLDILVLYVGRSQRFLYIPAVHIQRVKEVTMEQNSIVYEPPTEKPIEPDSLSISFRGILTSAKGRFVEVYVTGNKSIHGYLTSIMNNHFVFYSPVFKTVFISMDHVKWLIPYPEHSAPYSIINQTLPAAPASIPLARSFEDQCKKLENHLVVIDGGDSSEKIGLLQKVLNSQLTLVTAEREIVYRNLKHVKTIHFT
ncbi:DUF2642 domain-containing protein [Neobacillus niacini]|uniref:DUF2642 domain-containing protein n=1 Tax=Neobacillus niacini TaxID=86668 RepID=UPI00203D17A6|nr:DUF2642 domain-containing protein [Neobacillus niacini]MCM3693482.1 DUF2642 domain-containing protein [Neobacillus niacini]